MFCRVVISCFLGIVLAVCEGQVAKNYSSNHWDETSVGNGGQQSGSSAQQPVTFNAENETDPSIRQGLIQTNLIAVPRQVVPQVFSAVPRYRYPPPRPYFPPVRYPYRYYGPPASTSSSTSRRRLLTMFALLLLNQNQQPPSPPSPTTSSGVGCGQWQQWAACSNNCDGQRARIRTCPTGTETDFQRCTNKGVWRPNGWYRATNCLEYQVFTTPPLCWTAAETACQATTPPSRLASTGIRDLSIRNEVMLAMQPISGTVVFSVGVDDENAEGTYVWSDGVTQMQNDIDYWGVGETFTNPNRDCGRMIMGNLFSLRMRRCCADTRAYLCERVSL